MYSSFRRFDRSTSLFIGLLVISFLLATFDVRAQGAGIGDVMRDGAQSLFSPLQSAADAVTRPARGFVDGISNIAGLREENEGLTRLVAELERLVQDADELERRVAELEKISDLEPPGELTAITARVVSSGPSDFDQIRFIDKGSADGIVKGQPVIDENGLVGRVDFVSEHSARVRLITDSRFGVGVRDLATGDSGWAEGRGSGPLRLEMFNAVEPVRAGDSIVTDGSRFPPGILVGVVLKTTVSDVGFALFSTVEPSVELSRLDFVKVIVGWSPLDAGLEETQTTTTTTIPTTTTVADS